MRLSNGTCRTPLIGTNDDRHILNYGKTNTDAVRKADMYAEGQAARQADSLLVSRSVESPLT